MENSRKSPNGKGKTTFVFKEKLAFLSEKLRTWNMEILGHLNLEVEEAVKDLNILDFMAASGC